MAACVDGWLLHFHLLTQNSYSFGLSFSLLRLVVRLINIPWQRVTRWVNAHVASYWLASEIRLCFSFGCCIFGLRLSLAYCVFGLLLSWLLCFQTAPRCSWLPRFLAARLPSAAASPACGRVLLVLRKHGQHTVDTRSTPGQHLGQHLGQHFKNHRKLQFLVHFK